MSHVSGSVRAKGRCAWLGIIVALCACGRIDFDLREPAAPCASPSIETVLAWSTFLGGPATEYGHATATDGSGAGYVCGMSIERWGTPVRAFGDGNWEAVVAKLDVSGNLVWHTFLGQSGSAGDYCRGIAVATDGHVVVAGTSYEEWGTPLRAHASGADAFIARLDASGGLLWVTFLGGAGDDDANDVAVGADGTIHVAGRSAAAWGTPVHPFAGGAADAFVAQLSPDGTLLWSTFLGGTGEDAASSLVVGPGSIAHVAGTSVAGWGTPVAPFAGGGGDAWTATLGPTGMLEWHTFVGGSGAEDARDIARAQGDGLILGGRASAAWGAPIRGFSGGGGDGFVVRLDPRGALEWITFLGGDADDVVDGVVLDARGTLYVSGFSRSSWGTPVSPYAGGASDAYVARLEVDGSSVWHRFVGSSGGAHPFDDDYGNALAIRADGSILLVGDSDATWGAPRRAFTSGHDIFAAVIDDRTTCP
jgi:hypothetical protein